MWMTARPKAWVLALDLWGSGNRPDKLKQGSGGVSVKENVANAILPTSFYTLSCF